MCTAIGIVIMAIGSVMLLSVWAHTRDTNVGVLAIACVLITAAITVFNTQNNTEPCLEWTEEVSKDRQVCMASDGGEAICKPMIIKTCIRR